MYKYELYFIYVGIFMNYFMNLAYEITLYRELYQIIDSIL